MSSFHYPYELANLYADSLLLTSIQHCCNTIDVQEDVQAEPDDLGAMEFFILTLVGRMGLGSLYALRQEVGLEPGGIRSALKHLIDGDLITRGDEGKRRRREMMLTPVGFDVLAGSWRNCLRADMDSESVLRAAFVAWVMAGPGAAAPYLYEVSEARKEMAEKVSWESEHLKRSQKGATSSYSWMHASLEAHRRKAESEAFLSMSRSIEERFKNDASNVQ